MKYLFCKSSDGTIDYNGTVADDTVVPVGCWAGTEEELGFMSPIPWLADKVWDDALGRPRAFSTTEQLERARTDKRTELENEYVKVFRAQFPQGDGVVIFLGVFMSNQNDPRIVAVRTAQQRLDQRTTALADLGRSGRPALTFENIAAIVW